MAVIARRLGRRVKPSGKLYKRRSKHKNPEGKTGIKIITISRIHIGLCYIRLQ